MALEAGPARPVEARPAAPSDDIATVLRRMSSVRLEALPSEVLRAMEDRLAGQQEALRQEALALERRMLDGLARGDGVRFEPWRKAVRHVARENGEIEDQIERVHNAYQARVLEDRMIETLGSRRRVHALEGLVLVLIFVVLTLLVYELLHPDLSMDARLAFFAVDTACCGVFLAEFFLRLRCAESKRWFWRRHWIDFATSIPMPDALLLRSGRLFRVARVTRVSRAARMARFLRLIRGIRILLFFWRGFDKLYDVLNVRLMKRSLAVGLFFLVLGAAAILLAEGRAESQAAVDTPVEALWWSFTTVVTGGFGDIHNPATGLGQITTVVLVIAGMVVVGVFTATLTALLVGDESEEIEALQRAMDSRLDALASQVESLTQRRDAAGPEA